MRLSKNSKKAGLALMGSMMGFLVAKWCKTEEVYPFILIGGFLGNYIGEEYISETEFGSLGSLKPLHHAYVRQGRPEEIVVYVQQI